MWIMILTTIIFFYERSHFAAYLLMPYLTWVTLATYLNGFIVMNNPDPSLQKDSKQKAKR
jgi:tryptophan-rich sensory protein